MTTYTAQSGKFDEALPFDLQTFTKTFVASLVVRNLFSVRPHSPGDRRGFAGVVQLLDEKIEELEIGDAEQQLIRPIVRIANELRSSNTGGYEGFEAALRSLQLTFTSSPNPFYEEITFSVPKPYAEAIVAGLPESHRHLVTKAAEIFIQARGI